MTTDFFDFNDAPEQREFDLVPKGTVASIRITVRPGGAGDGGWLKRSKDGASEMLDLEFVLIDTRCARRKFWENMVVAGTTDGHAKAAEISRSRLRAILESARGIKPDDTSAEAREKRRATYQDFDGLTFIGKIGIEKGEPRGNGENYPDRNCLDAVITPDKKDWHQVEQAPRPQSSSSDSAPAAVVPIKKPAWAS
jgi:hypothetical protein